MFSLALRAHSRSALRTSTLTSSASPLCASARGFSSLFSSLTQQRSLASRMQQHAVDNTAGVRQLSMTVPRFIDGAYNDSPARTERPDSNSVFVGNLPWGTTEDELHDLVATYGEVSGVRIAKGSDGRPRGFAHVEFKSRDAAVSAVSDFRAEPPLLNDRELRFDFAPAQRQQQRRGQQGQNAERRHSNAPAKSLMPETDSIFVGNVPFGTTEDELFEIVSTFGEVKDIRIAKSIDGRQKGFAHIDFASLDSAKAAVTALSGQPPHIQDRTLRIDFAPLPNSKNKFPPSRTLFLHGFRGVEADLRKAFESYASDITRVSLVRDQSSNQPTGICFIDFKDVETASEARNALNNTDTEAGHKLAISFGKGPQTSSTSRGSNRGFADTLRRQRREDY